MEGILMTDEDQRAGVADDNRRHVSATPHGEPSTDQGCSLCPEALAASRDVTVFHLTEWWTVAHRDDRNGRSRLRLAVVPAIHVPDLRKLPVDAQADFWEVLSWVDERRESLAIRFGASWLSGCEWRVRSGDHVWIDVAIGVRSGSDPHS